MARESGMACWGSMNGLGRTVGAAVTLLGYGLTAPEVLKWGPRLWAGCEESQGQKDPLVSSRP